MFQYAIDTQHRRRIIRIMLVLVLILVLLLIGSWFWMTQPLLSAAKPSSERTVDPSRLHAHVRKLSVELSPRDENHIENLDRVAAYIKDESSPLPVYSINAPTIVPGVDLSDHVNYWRAGYNALMITDTALYRNRNYHTAQDTEEKLDYKRMAMVVEGVYAAVVELTSLRPPHRSLPVKQSALKVRPIAQCPKRRSRHGWTMFRSHARIP